MAPRKKTTKKKTPKKSTTANVKVIAEVEPVTKEAKTVVAEVKPVATSEIEIIVLNSEPTKAPAKGPATVQYPSSTPSGRRYEARRKRLNTLGF